MSTYGSAELYKHEDGTVTVGRADRVIGVTRELWEQMQAPHKRDDGTLWLDTAGEYRYRYLRTEPHWQTREWDVLVFAQIEELSTEEIRNPAPSGQEGRDVA